MAKKADAKLFDVEARKHHGAKPGMAARGMTKEDADKYAAAMTEAHPGYSYTVVDHNPKA